MYDRSGRLQRLPTRWRPRRRVVLQTQVRENLLDDDGSRMAVMIFDLRRPANCRS
jgi:hypothetical protein